LLQLGCQESVVKKTEVVLHSNNVGHPKSFRGKDLRILVALLLITTKTDLQPFNLLHVSTKKQRCC